MAMANKIMKRSLRFFGPHTPKVKMLPVPVGLRCSHCDAPLGADATGVVYQRSDACYASYADCYANGAVKSFLLSFLQDT
jgi:hypothetical protein